MNGPSRITLLSAGLLAALVLASLGGSLQADFVWDDRPLIVENPWVKDPAGFVHVLTSSFWETGDRHDRFRSFFRPLVSLSYGIDHAIWGLNPFGFHLSNLLLHLACCWLVFRIALREVSMPTWAALGGASLFAVHPVHVESVAWISGRTDLMCGAFVLGAFLLHRRVLAGRGLRAARAASVTLFLLALFSKEMAATFPALVFADVWLDRGGGLRRLRGAAMTALPYVAAFGLYLVARTLVLGTGSPPLYALAPVEFIATATFVVARYLTLLILPFGLDAHYPYQALRSLLAPLAIVGGLMLAVVGGLAVHAWRRSPRAAFWLGWTLVGLLPVLAFGRFGDVLMADRFLYLPSVGLALLAARGLGLLSRVSLPPMWVRSAVALFAVVLVLMTGGSWKRTAVWRDDLTLFSDMVRTSPASALVRNNLGLSLYHRGDWEAAGAEFLAAVEISPGYSLAHNNLAATLERAGRLGEALGEYRRALAIAPELVEARTNEGHMLVLLGRSEEGLAILRGQAAGHPNSPAILYSLADALFRTGQYDEALGFTDRIREIEPGHPESHYLAGRILHERGRGPEAATAMRAFLAVWPEDGPHAAAARRVIDAAVRGTVPGDSGEVR